MIIHKLLFFSSQSRNGEGCGEKMPNVQQPKRDGGSPETKTKGSLWEEGDRVKQQRKGYISELSSGSISKRTIRERKCLRYMKER